VKLIGRGMRIGSMERLGCRRIEASLILYGSVRNSVFAEGNGRRRKMHYTELRFSKHFDIDGGAGQDESFTGVSG
jgi:hypothetical protein